MANAGHLLIAPADPLSTPNGPAKFFWVPLVLITSWAPFLLASGWILFQKTEGERRGNSGYFLPCFPSSGSVWAAFLI